VKSIAYRNARVGIFLQILWGKITLNEGVATVWEWWVTKKVLSRTREKLIYKR